jgi:membrane protease YdiL (CAAX protease family)
VDDLVTVASFDFRADAEVQKLLLEENGIQAFLADDNLVGLNWFLSNAVGGVKLQVAEADADRANEILKQHQPVKDESKEAAAEEDIIFACQECGKKITFPGERRGCVETCPECGSYVDVPRATEPAFVASPDDVTQEKVVGTSERTNAQIWIEVLAVVCLAYLPVLYDAVTTTDYAARASRFLTSTMVFRIIAAVQVSMPLLVIIALTKDPWSLFGIVRPKWIWDIAIGCVVWFCCARFYHFVILLLPASMLDEASSSHVVNHARPEGLPATLLFLVATVASAFWQEFVYRGYLIPRFERLFRSTWAAVLITTAMFASYHVYYGDAASVIGIAAMGLVYATAFCFLRRLWPLWLAHALHNILVSL